MWDNNDPKSKWLHLVVKLIAALIIFKLGVMVGEFKIIKAMVLRGGAHQKMLFKGDENGFFEKRVLPGQGGNMMFWKGEGPGPDSEKAPLP